MRVEADHETKQTGIQDLVKDHPVIALGVAAGVGFLATRFISGGFIKKSAALVATVGIKHYLPNILQAVSGEGADKTPVE